MNTLNIQPANRLGDVKEYYFSKKLREIAQMRAAGKEIINLGIGSPDLPPAPEVIAQLHTQSQEDTNHAYQSYVGAPALRKAFSDWYSNWFDVELDANQEVLPLIGSKEGLMHIAMAYLGPGDEALVPNPGYPAYQSVSKLAGAKVRNYNLLASNNWLPDLKALARTDLSKVKIMWVNYPNMPTGKRADYSFFEELIAFGRAHHILICNDNPYAFILNNKPISLLKVPGAKSVAIELNSLSKSHNMAGWRVGMLAGQSHFLQTILRFKSNMDSGMFLPVQLAAAKALQLPNSWYSNLNAIYLKRRAVVFSLLDHLGCTYATDQVGMFVWAKIPNQFTDGFQLSDKVLYESGVFITPGGIFGTEGSNYIRISLCSSTTVFEKALDKIKQSIK